MIGAVLQELQGDRRLARPRRALKEKNMPPGKPATKDIVKSVNARQSRRFHINIPWLVMARNRANKRLCNGCFLSLLRGLPLRRERLQSANIREAAVLKTYV